jgi:hypothetical protein
MNVVIQQTPEHRTHDGHTGTYAVLFDAPTARKVGMLQIVERGDGTVEYRDTDQRSLPLDFSMNDAIRFAIADQQRRRASRPAKPAKPQRIRRQRIDRWYTPPKPIRPMRQLLVTRLQARYAMKGAA